MKKLLSHIKFNAPVTLGFVMVCGIALLLDHITGGWANRHLFSTYRSGLLNPMTYVRAFGYTIGHADWAHFTANMTYILPGIKKSKSLTFPHSLAYYFERMSCRTLNPIGKCLLVVHVPSGGYDVVSWEEPFLKNQETCV